MLVEQLPNYTSVLGGTMGRLEGQVAFITGAARGQGRSHAVRLAEEGCDIIALDLCADVPGVPYAGPDEGDLAETVRLVEGLGRGIVSAVVDVRDLAAVQGVVDRGVAAFGRLDIVLANAGIVGFGPTLEMAEDAWSTMIDINLTGAWKTVRASVPHILDGGRGGAVVLTSSSASFMTMENVAHYSAAKSGLVGLMRVLAKELAPHRVRVNTVHPTTVATEMVMHDATYRLFRPDLPNPTRADIEPILETMHALPVAGVESIDISNAILYLVSDDGRYVTGTTHLVTAGAEL
jgi:SDR family mycofactocin-dependent oxidoreductase